MTLPSALETPAASSPDASEQSERWAHVVEHAGWGIAVGSRDGTTIEAMNPEFARMHGHTVAELLGRPIVDLFAPDARASVGHSIRLAHERGSHSFESEHVRSDGSTFPVEVNVNVVKDAAGAVLYRAVHVRDISDRRRRDAVMRAATLSRDVLDRLLEGCQVIGFDFRYLYLNELAVRQSRSTLDGLIGRTMMQCFPGIEHTPMFAQLGRCMVGRQPGHMENEFNFPDGTRFVFELRFLPVPQGVCILSLDISERRHRLAAIVNDSDDAIVGSTLAGVITSWNRSAERIFGYTADETLGHQALHLITGESNRTEGSVASRLAAGERVNHFETQRRHKDGHLIDVSVTASAVRDPSGAIIGVSSIARDISDLKRIQRELERAKELAESTSRELEAFSYSVAHDLRAPLRSIDGFSQALLEDYQAQLDATGQRYLGFVRESAQLMARLIDDILMLSRVTRSELDDAPVDLTALARSIATRLSHQAPDRQVEWAIADGLSARGDGRLIATAFENLLGNAWKFTSKQRLARIELTCLGPDPVERIAHGASESDGCVFVVRDNGTGFDMAYASKLFGVFQRLHSAQEFEGTGVGLAIVQRVMHRHGGRVWARATPGQGAAFYFTFGSERDP